jgi:chromosome segregation ATPase
MKDFRTWALIILALAFALYILLDKDPVDNSEKIQSYEIALKIADQEILNLRSDSTKLSQKIDADSVRHANERKVYKEKVKSQSALISRLKAKPEVITIREQSVDVDSLLTAMEAKDSIQTARIDTLENNLSELRVDMSAVNDNCSKMLEAERERFQAQKGISEEYSKQVRKERRKKRLATALIPVVGVAGFLLGAQL